MNKTNLMLCQGKGVTYNRQLYRTLISHPAHTCWVDINIFYISYFQVILIENESVTFAKEEL